MKLIFFSAAVICSSYLALSDEHKPSIMTATADSTVYSNKLYRVVLFREGGKMNKFKIRHLNNLAEFTGKPVLITIDGGAPEGTNRTDYNDPKDQMGYPCDNAYECSSSRFEIVFAVEKGTKRRMDLIIHRSKDKNFKDGYHTLVKI